MKVGTLTIAWLTLNHINWNTWLVCHMKCRAWHKYVQCPYLLYHISTARWNKDKCQSSDNKNGTRKQWTQTNMIWEKWIPGKQIVYDSFKIQNTMKDKGWMDLDHCDWSWTMSLNVFNCWSLWSRITQPRSLQLPTWLSSVANALMNWCCILVRLPLAFLRYTSMSAQNRS